MPGRQVLAAHVLEVVANAWDLARALGDRRPLDAGLARGALAGARQVLPAERRGGPVPFGPVRPAPDGADAYEELAAWLGRDARWAAPGVRTAADAAAAGE